MQQDWEEVITMLKTYLPDILAEFESSYEDPAYFNEGICSRCSAKVTSTHQHSEWHKALSLMIYCWGSTARFLLDTNKKKGT